MLESETIAAVTDLRALFNRLRRRWVRVWFYRVVFGERSGGRGLPHARISPATCIEHEQGLVLGDHVYIGPFNFLEASGGITLGEGVQVTSHCSIVTHSSHRAMRLLGRSYADWVGGCDRPRPGWIGGPVVIGPYSFIGPHSVIEANSHLGRGTQVCAGSRVRGHFPDFAVLAGQPACIVGDTRQADERLLARFPELRPLYQAWAGDPSPVSVAEGEG